MCQDVIGLWLGRFNDNIVNEGFIHNNISPCKIYTGYYGK